VTENRRSNLVTYGKELSPSDYKMHAGRFNRLSKKKKKLETKVRRETEGGRKKEKENREYLLLRKSVVHINSMKFGRVI